MRLRRALSAHRPVVVPALGTLMSPLSKFLLWLAPFGKRGGPTEWVMLSFFSLLSVGLLIGLWRGRMTGSFSFKRELPTYLVLGGFHVTNLLFALVGGYWKILPYQLVLAGVQIGFLWIVNARGRSRHGLMSEAYSR